MGAHFGSALGQSLSQIFQPMLEQRTQQMQQQRQSTMLQHALTQAQQIYADPNLSPEQKQIGLYQSLHRNPEIAQALGNQLQKFQQQAQSQQMLGQIFGPQQQMGQGTQAEQQPGQAPQQGF